MINQYNSFPDDPDKDLFIELQEDDARIDLITEFHAYYDVATASDDAADQAVDQTMPHPLMLEDRMRHRRYTWHETNGLIVPAPARYREMIWRPDSGTSTAQTVGYVAVRYPQLSGEDTEIPELAEVPEITVKDVFIEVVYRDGRQSYRGHLNDHELAVYPDGQSLQLYTDEILPALAKNVTPNVYRVIGEHWYLPEMSAVELKQIVLTDSYFEQNDGPVAPTEHPET